jgi:hypothetical protein
MKMMQSCTTLRSTSPLPEGWSDLEVVADIIVADGVELHRVGMATTGPQGEEITGSAAEASFSPEARSYFELLERAATLQAIKDLRPIYELRSTEGLPVGECAAGALFPESDAPALWRYARSSGVAIHADWKTAALRASWELAERDRLLRAWYGEIRPERLVDCDLAGLARATSYEWCAFSFPEPSIDHFSRQLHVVGVFGFPGRADAPLVLGYGARPDLEGAVEAATREAMQGLAFLWGEPVTDHAPELGPTPMHHLERFQFRGHHQMLERWLDGSHTSYRPRATPRRPNASVVAFADLTPPWLGGGYRVAKAFCSGAVPLAFGDAPFAAHLPAALRAHPIA